MTRREDRREASRQRAEEHLRRRRRKFWVFAIALGLYVGVPVLRYGAIEFGWARPIQNPEFKSALNLMGSVSLLVLLELYSRWRGWNLWGNWSKKKQTPKTSSVSTT